MSFSFDELRKIMPYAKPERIDLFLLPLNDAMREWEIDTPLREAAFIAQVAHESGSLKYVRELADGSAYEGRFELGNTHYGDGVRYKGRGLIQITGRANYQACGDALGLPLVEEPELLEQPSPAARSAAWFWDSRGLNELADSQEFKLITKRINGGYNGFPERVAFYQRALSIL